MQHRRDGFLVPFFNTIAVFAVLQQYCTTPIRRRLFSFTAADSKIVVKKHYNPVVYAKKFLKFA